MLNKLTSIALAGTIALSGCSNKDNQTLNGLPISVGESFARKYGTLATVIDINGKKVLGYSRYSTTLKNAEAVALIQSEISDNDNEPVELTGKYVDDRFEIKSIKANGYQVDF